MKINNYFYPMIREFKDLEYGDCFVRGDIPFMKIESADKGVHPVNAVMLDSGTACHVPINGLCIVADVEVSINLVEEDRSPLISADLEKEIVDSWNRGEVWKS